MSVQRRQWLFPLLCLILSACSTSQGFDRVGIQETLRQRMHLDGTSEADNAKTTNARESRASFTEPFRLGIYFVRTEFPTRQSVRSGEWLSAEKDQLVQQLTPLRTGQILREIVVLAEPTVRTFTAQELRQASVRYGIDVLVLVDGAGAVNRHNNAYAILYPTVIGAWLAPGTISDALFMIHGVLWDLRTDKRLDEQTVEGQAQRTGAVVLMDDMDTLTEAKRLTIDAFGKRLADRLRSLTGAQSGGASSPQ